MMPFDFTSDNTVSQWANWDKYHRDSPILRVQSLDCESISIYSREIYPERLKRYWLWELTKQKFGLLVSSVQDWIVCLICDNLV